MSETRTLLIDRDNEQLRITIPASWKVTFGVVRSGRDTLPKVGAFNGGGRDLRLYEAGEHCRAVFTDVDSFRDLSIPVERRKVTRKGKESWQADSAGNRRTESEEAVDSKWVKDDE